MGITLGDAILHLKTDRSELESGLQGATGGIASWLGGVQGAITTGLVGAMVGGVMQGIRAAADEQTAFMKLEAVYRATGGAVGMTVDQLRQLASQMFLLTGIEDDNFMAAEALAMTYGNISGDVMPRLLTVAADMAALFDGDVVSSTRNVAIALSAGEDGLMRLRRAGVIFTDEQKEMIATMMAAGDAAGAQNIILTELESRFGGTAAAAVGTFNGRMVALKSAVGELWEGLGNLNIGGRTLVQWMTDGITTATSLITMSGQVDLAFESTRDEIARSATTYDDYFEAQLGIAENAGKITALNAALIRSLREGSGATELDAVSIRGLWQELENLGIITSSSMWEQMRSGLESLVPPSEDANAATASLWHTPRDAAGGWDEGARAVGAFGAKVNTLPREHTTTLNIETEAAEQELDAFMARIAASGLWSYIGGGGFNIGGGGVVVGAGGGGGAAVGAPGTVSAAIAWRRQAGAPTMTAAELIAAGYTPGQHGLGFDVEGPSGSDQVPVNLALTRGEHVDVTPAVGDGGRVVNNYVTFNTYVNDRDDLAALEQQIMTVFRGV